MCSNPPPLPSHFKAFPEGGKHSGWPTCLPSLVLLARFTPLTHEVLLLAWTSNTLLCFALCSRPSLHPPRLPRNVFSPSISVPTSPCHDLQTGWRDSPCYSVNLASFNRCRCTRCWNVFPRSPQFLIMLLKWLCICHHFHITFICFNCTQELFQLFVANSWLNAALFVVYKLSRLFLGSGSCWVTEIIQDNNFRYFEARAPLQGAGGHTQLLKSHRAPCRLAPHPTSRLVFSEAVRSLLIMNTSCSHRVCTAWSFGSVTEIAPALTWQQPPLWTELRHQGIRTDVWPRFCSWRAHRLSSFHPAFFRLPVQLAELHETRELPGSRGASLHVVQLLAVNILPAWMERGNVCIAPTLDLRGDDNDLRYLLVFLKSQR